MVNSRVGGIACVICHGAMAKTGGRRPCPQPGAACGAGGPGSEAREACKSRPGEFLVSSRAARCLSTFLVEAYYERP